jgi:uridine kinase
MSPSPLETAAPFIARLVAELERGAAPVFVALDGRSGAGKSTLAAAVVAELGRQHGVPVTMIEGDQFYAGGSAATWDRRSAVERAAHGIDWRRQRAALSELRTHGVAAWHPFDWDAPDWDAEVAPLQSEPIRSVIAPIVILEGAYSARPELHDLLDLRVLLDVATDLRRRQLLDREGEEYRADWESRWSAAEDHYFGTVMPPHRFDLVLRVD